MNAEERADLAMRLIAMHGVLKDLAEAAADQGALCKQAHASGLAMSAFMLQEAILAYSKELTKWAAEYLAENHLDKT